MIFNKLTDLIRIGVFAIYKHAYIQILSARCKTNHFEATRKQPKSLQIYLSDEKWRISTLK